MPLATRIAQLAYRIAAEIKALRKETFYVRVAVPDNTRPAAHQVVDGVQVTTGDIVFHVEQGTVYLVKEADRAWVKHPDFLTSSVMARTAFVPREGVQNKGKRFYTDVSPTDDLANQVSRGASARVDSHYSYRPDVIQPGPYGTLTYDAEQRLLVVSDGTKFNPLTGIIRGTNLVSNGAGQMKSNYNFSQFALNATDVPTGATASFRADNSRSTIMSDELIVVDPAIPLRLDLDVRQVTGSGNMYVGLVPFDAYGNSILPYMYLAQPGSLTTLAQALKPGDTTVRLTSSANWHNGSTPHMRTLTFWDYVDPGGKAWPANTYTRNYYPDAYAQGGISGNVITLREPWAGPQKPAGTEVSAGASGGAYLYIAASLYAAPSTWTRISGRTLPGVHPSGTLASAYNRLPMMTAAVRLLFLPNYQQTGNQVQAFANIGLRENTEMTSYRAVRNAALDMPSAVTSHVPLDSVALDTDGMYNADGMIYIQRPGVYRIDAQVGYSTNSATGVRDVYIYIRGVQRAAARVPAGSGTPLTVSTSLVTSLVPGDFIRIFGYQNSGAAMAITATAVWTYANVEMIQPA